MAVACAHADLFRNTHQQPPGTVAEGFEASLQGRVVYVNGDGGYGFIRPLGGKWDKDAFFHQSAVADAITLRKGQRVSFAVTQSERGPKATDIQMER